MRVVAGKFRGATLKSPSDDFVRPTTDKVREALFGILAPRIEGARFLDLFGGAGGIGIEALSRGAAEVTIVDSARASYRLIRENLAHVKAEAEVVYADYLVALKRFAAEGRRFDIVYIDPPYATDYDEKAAAFVAANGLLASDGLAIVEHPTKKSVAPAGLVACDTRKYGCTALTFFRPAAAAEEERA